MTNNLHINTDKTTTALFIPDPAENGTTLSLKLNNQTLTTTKQPKILEITVNPKLTFSQHINVTSLKENKQIFKALASTKWGEQKELVVFSRLKAITHSIFEYANTW